jgi:hypothetical protein
MVRKSSYFLQNWQIRGKEKKGFLEEITEKA